jgi:hypothetical protein
LLLHFRVTEREIRRPAIRSGSQIFSEVILKLFRGIPVAPGMKQNPTSPIRPKTTTPPFLIALALVIACLAFLPGAQAVVPAPDGGYPGGNTAEGQAALLSLTTGGFNTAIGFSSLRNDTIGQLNTALGAGTLLANTADSNTATGAGALLSNTTGTFNTANGTFALFYNTAGDGNTASGRGALANNTTNGGSTAIGFQALALSTGGHNTAIGESAGFNQTSGSGNVYIGALMQGVAGENNTCYIRGIFGATSANGIPVLINSNNKLGTTTSSKRFKEDIKAMNKASEALFSLRPVTFRYKKEIDPAGTGQLGLVAEEVERVNPDLVVRDKEGKPYSVRYEQVNAMLLNEFLKAHRRIEEQDKRIDQLTAQLKEQALLIQKVNDKVELNRSAPQTVANDQ